MADEDANTAPKASSSAKDDAEVKEESGAGGSGAPSKAPAIRSGGRRKGRRNMRAAKRSRSESSDDEDEGDKSAVVRPTASKKAINTFGTKTGKPKQEGLIENLQVKSSRDVVPAKYSGDATAEVQIDGPAAGGKQGNKHSGIGPIKAPSNIRSSARFDYAPDICKDYKETGTCGYGDSCIFMHDRGDYKFGWQIEKEWEEEQKRKREALERGEAYESGEDDDKYVIDSDEEELPFACWICRNPFTDPVVTQCNHYFCRTCAVKRYQKKTTCAVCGQQTLGAFNAATKLIAKLKKIEEKAAAEAAAEGSDDAKEGASGDDEDDDDEGGWGVRPESPPSRSGRVAVGVSAPPSSSSEGGGWSVVSK